MTSADGVRRFAGYLAEVGAVGLEMRHQLGPQTLVRMNLPTGEAALAAAAAGRRFGVAVRDVSTDSGSSWGPHFSTGGPSISFVIPDEVEAELRATVTRSLPAAPPRPAIGPGPDTQGLNP